ncbi:MAG: radical SAM protein [Planctomycetota bacterium]|jgi:radical SAM protein with 4Fe4S-binding SPASM domain
MTRSTAKRSASKDVSRTHVARHTTAAAVGKQYEHEFRASANPDKRPERSDDGNLTSAQYVETTDALVDLITNRALQIDFHHPLERYLNRRAVRWLLGRVCRVDSHGETALERIITSYRNADAPLSRRVRYWLFHRFIDRMRGEVDVATFRKRLADHRPTVRGLVIVARSLAEFGLTTPQKFVAPLFAVWNFTNRCNLACKHCYQDSQQKGVTDELPLEAKLDLVDQMGAAHMPMLALSGGEPTISDHLLPVLHRANEHHMHLTLATNGTTMTPELAAQLAAAGLRYVEISLDSVDSARHDAFRGREGLWERSVRGAKTVVATEGLRLGIAMCVHQGNFHEVRDMIRFAEDLGAGCFAHFNFIPVGRGLRMVAGDITPAQREQLLGILNAQMQTGGMGVISTAPQLGRICLAGAAGEDGRVSCSHAGSGSGVKARVVAKYLGGCGAGRTYVCIEPNGNVTPCVYMPHRVMGNVREKPLMAIFRDSVFWEILNDRERRLHHCEVCAFRNYCGGCRARADAYFGELHAGDPGCIFNDRHWERLVADGVAVVEDDITDPADVELTPTRHGLA